MANAYAWTSNWECPQCHKKHSKPHFAMEDQINYKKDPDTKGRIKDDKKREKDITCEEYEKEMGTGSTFDENGLQRPLFCPHCGYEDTLLYINKENVPA